MYSFRIVTLFLCLPIGVFAQIKELHNRIEPYYDYFIFGVTDKSIKNIKELAKKYELKGRSIYYNSDMHKRLPSGYDYENVVDHLKMNKGDTLLLPAFTLDPIRLDFEKYFPEIVVGKQDTLSSSRLTVWGKKYIPLDSNAVKELSKVRIYHKKITFFEIPEVDCSLDSIMPIGKISVNSEFKLYLVEAKNFNSAYRNIYVYPVRNNRLMSLPIVAHFSSPQYEEYIYSRIFYYNGELILLQTLRNNKFEIHWYKKVSLYEFPSYQYNDVWSFTKAESRCLYEVLKSGVASDEELINKLKITKED